MLLYDYLRSHVVFVRLYLPNSAQLLTAEVISRITIFSVIRTNYIDSMALYGELTLNLFKLVSLFSYQYYFFIIKNTMLQEALLLNQLCSLLLYKYI